MTAPDKPEDRPETANDPPPSPEPENRPDDHASGVRYGDASRRRGGRKPRSERNGGGRRTPRTEPPPPPGIVVVDKPTGMSSMTVVSIVRRKAGLKAGHAGTLDPLATGVLVVGIGAATKHLESFMKTRKGYRTEIDLSAFTATDDREGELQTVEVTTPPERDVVAAMLAERFTGIFHQVPPDFSAKKVGGQRAYAAARRGDAPKLEPRPVEVHEIALVEYAWPIATVEVSCEKGFYVRSLARDLGTALGTGGHCASIRRTAVGPFGLENAVGPDDLPEIMPDEAVLPLEDALAMLTD
ncbi:MAG: tRNA pseudouridine(55) synthase TruB [Phycisphaerae bacterium]|nr:tRNA pseudouridine(55) synthase TruB [Phycisphaerae bacterium]